MLERKIGTSIREFRDNLCELKFGTQFINRILFHDTKRNINAVSKNNAELKQENENLWLKCNGLEKNIKENMLRETRE